MKGPVIPNDRGLKYKITCKEFDDSLVFEDGFCDDLSKPFSARVTEMVVDFKEEHIKRKLVSLGWSKAGEDWVSVSDRLPSKGEYVLAIAPSGYVGYPWNYFTADCDPGYKGWVTTSNDRITDYGEDVLFWKPLLTPPAVSI